ncbi:hypothetical protein GX50_02559 [[Emmonsia] crescens]|uniref:F-box domain-containing protein n=1 Tax=[Emmonsia] crescens TaxID=73230 RepID=A0A2B7ZKT2_9EURO|nr:hypothetical protein GX50_02559 [Emmonsia crescens]
MAFLNIPSELILNIADEIPNIQDLNSLSQTCRDLYSLLNNYLYHRDAESGDLQALFWAAYKGLIPPARKALSHGADIHAKDTSPSSFPHHFAQSHSRRWDSCPTTLNFTPLHIATRYRHESMVRFLIQHGADIHAPFPAHHDGYPLHVVSCNGPTGLVKLLLEKGAEVDVRNSKGWTPLYCAMRSLSISMPNERRAARIRLLLDYDADPDATDKAGKSPRQLAKKCRDPYIRMMLLGDKGARVSLYEANLEGRRFRDNFLLKEVVVGEKGTLDSKLDNNVTTSLALEDVKGSKSKRSRKRSKKRKKKQPEIGEGAIGGETKEVIGKQISTTPVHLAKLDDKAIAATTGRQAAWAKMRAAASRCELEVIADRELPKPFGCLHLSIGLFRIKRKLECGSCRYATKQSFLCPACDAVLCSKCVNERFTGF